MLHVVGQKREVMNDSRGSYHDVGRTGIDTSPNRPIGEPTGATRDFCIERQNAIVELGQGGAQPFLGGMCPVDCASAAQLLNALNDLEDSNR